MWDKGRASPGEPSLGLVLHYFWCRLGAVCRRRCRSVPPLAAALRSLDPNLLVFLGFVFSCQRGGRRFEPGLVLQICPPRVGIEDCDRDIAVCAARRSRPSWIHFDWTDTGTSLGGGPRRDSADPEHRHGCDRGEALPARQARRVGGSLRHDPRGHGRSPRVLGCRIRP